MIFFKRMCKPIRLQILMILIVQNALASLTIITIYKFTKYIASRLATELFTRKLLKLKIIFSGLLNIHVDIFKDFGFVSQHFYVRC